MNKIEREPPSNDLLKTFVAIAESENLTHAATRLNRTQSAISVQLKKLEDAMDTPLFDRQARGMSLNDQGRRLLPAARRALLELWKTTAIFDQPMTGSIAVGVPDDFEDMVLETALAGFVARHPWVEVRAEAGCTASFPDAITRGVLDVAVCSGPQSLPGQPLMAEPTVWACALSYAPPAEGAVQLVHLDRGCWWRDIAANALTGVGRTWTHSYQFASFASQRAAIRAGLSVGVLPIGAVDAGMRMLDQADGFPQLPLAHRSIMVRSDAPADLTSAMVAAIQEGVSRR